MQAITFKNYLFALLGALLTLSAYSQSYNIEKLGQLTYNTQLSAIWGYTDKVGNEYGIVGLRAGGVSIVNVTNPQLPNEVFRSTGPASIWREMKTYNNYAYIVTEQSGGGLQIIDLSTLPENKNLSVSNFTENGKWTTAHTLWIDDDGFMYIFGSKKFPGKNVVIIYDLKPNPLVPTLVKDYFVPYVHDGYVQGNKLYLGHIYDGFFSIHDISDKSNPVELGTQFTPLAFTHNVWPTADNKFAFTTDEKPDSHLAAYDVSDPENIFEVDRIQTAPGSKTIIHNVHVKGNHVISAYYTEGVTIHDVSDPSNIIEIGKYDTSPFSGGSFNGVWEVYPFFKSGNFIAGDIEQGLFVLKPTYVTPARMVGNIKNGVTKANLSNVKVEFISTEVSDSTRIDGNYKTGIANAGLYTVRFSKSGYQSATVSNVELKAGETLTLNYELFEGIDSVNELSAAGVQLNANPFSDKLQLRFTKASFTKANLKLVNELGQEVVNKNIDALGSQELETSQLAKGLYVLTLELNGNTFQQKVIKN